MSKDDRIRLMYWPRDDYYGTYARARFSTIFLLLLLLRQCPSGPTVVHTYRSVPMFRLPKVFGAVTLRVVGVKHKSLLPTVDIVHDCRRASSVRRI